MESRIDREHPLLARRQARARRAGRRGAPPLPTRRLGCLALACHRPVLLVVLRCLDLPSPGRAVTVVVAERSVQTSVRTACRSGAGRRGSGWLLGMDSARGHRGSVAGSGGASPSCWSGVGTPWWSPTWTATPRVVRRPRSAPSRGSAQDVRDEAAHAVVAAEAAPARPARRVGEQRRASGTTGRSTGVSSAARRRARRREPQGRAVGDAGGAGGVRARPAGTSSTSRPRPGSGRCRAWRCTPRPRPPSSR